MKAQPHFPQLAKLRQRRVQLEEEIEEQAKKVLQKQKGSPECIDFEGRLVIDYFRWTS
jgi:hypothetical protein